MLVAQKYKWLNPLPNLLLISYELSIALIKISGSGNNLSPLVITNISYECNYPLRETRNPVSIQLIDISL